MAASRVVLTGGPHAGKTTLLRSLEKKGHHVLPEAALAEIEQLVRDLGTEAARAWRQTNMAEFQLRVSERQARIEAGVTERHPGPCFFDRGVIDGLAYCQHRGVVPPAGLVEASKQARYDLVIVCELVLPFESRAASGRISDEQAARALQDLLERTYQAHGVRTVRLPVTSTEKRLAMLEDLVREA
jgi:predicted ATPase